jgi:V8-like Glu-specific endopeptidase
MFNGKRVMVYWLRIVSASRILTLRKPVGPCFVYMRKFILSVLLSGIVVPSMVAQDVLPSALHAVPVLIELPTAGGISFGTGFYMVMGTNVFLVTAAHVIFASPDPNDTTLISSTIGLLSYDTNENARLSNTFTINLSQYQKEGRIKRYPTHDVAVLYAGTSEPPYRNVAWSAISGHQSSATHTWGTNECTLFSNVPDGSQTITLGYPAELLKPDAIQLQSLEKAWAEADIDFDYPLIRPGSVAQKSLSKGKIILNSDVYGGNSGGPVLIVQHPSLGVTDYRIVGLVTKFVPVLTRDEPRIGLTNTVEVYSGYSVAEPIDYAIELMRQFETTNNTNDNHK